MVVGQVGVYRCGLAHGAYLSCLMSGELLRGTNRADGVGFYGRGRVAPG